MSLTANWSFGASSSTLLRERSNKGCLLRRCLYRRASRPRCQEAAAMQTASPCKQHVCHTGGSTRVLMLRRGMQPLGRSTDQPPPLSSFEQQELPLHSRVLHGVHQRATFAVETAVEQAQDLVHQAPIWLHAFVCGLLEAVEQAVARLTTWAAGHSSPSQPQAAQHTPAVQHTATAAATVCLAAPQASASHQAAYAPSPAPHAGRQMHCSVQAAVGFSPSAMVLSCGMPHKAALLVVLLLALVLPRMWKRHWEEVDEMRQIQQLVEMNAVTLKRQKQRFQQALQVDSITLELPDIKDVPVDMSKALIALQPGSEHAMREQWESFMVTSKIGQVKDVWDAHEQADTGAPRATKKQLEEMTARVRAASSTVSEGSKRHSVSFEELCGECDDFDADMANRVAQRKARFQGQFLSDEDVGLPSAPKRPNTSSPGSSPAAGAGSAPGNGRLGRVSDGGRLDGSAAPGTRRRAGWDEGRVRPGPSGSGDAGTSFAGAVPLLEIRPKKALRGGLGAGEGAVGGQAGGARENSAVPSSPAPRSQLGRQAELGGGDVGRSSGGAGRVEVGPPGPAAVLGRAVRLQRSAAGRAGQGSSPAGNGDVDDAELERSLLLRSQLHYVHPSLSVPLGGAAAKPQHGLGSPASSLGGRAEASDAPARSMGGDGASEVEPEGSAGPGQEEVDVACYAPVSSVSVGLLRGASRMRTGAERSRGQGAKAVERDEAQPAGPGAAQQQQQQQRQGAAGEGLAHLMRRPTSADQPTRQ